MKTILQIVKKAKKRLCGTNSWASVKARRLKNIGKSCEYRTGEVMVAKEMGPSCEKNVYLHVPRRFPKMIELSFQ